MLDNIKLLLGDVTVSDDLINLYYKQTVAEVSAYCNRNIDAELEFIVERIVVIKINRINTEGLTSQSYSGTSESYTDGYPADIMNVLNRKRLIKIL